MADKQRQSDRSVRLRSWIIPFLIYLSLLFILLLIDGTTWTVNFREGTFFEKNILHTSLFMDWFTPYSKPELNVIGLFLSVIFLPDIITKTIDYIKLRRKISA